MKFFWGVLWVTYKKSNASRSVYKEKPYSGKAFSGRTFQSWYLQSKYLFKLLCSCKMRICLSKVKFDILASYSMEGINDDDDYHLTWTSGHLLWLTWIGHI